MKELRLKTKEWEAIKKGVWFLSDEEFFDGDKIVVEDKFIGFIKEITEVEIFSHQKKLWIVFSKTFIALSKNNFRTFDNEHYHLLEEYYTVDNPKVETTLSLESKKYNG